MRFLNTSGFIDHWKGAYLTSNTLWAETGQPVGSRYTYWNGRHRILVFGFLYDFTDNCPSTVVEPVEQVVQQSWFLKVLQRQDFDAIVVLAHMDCEDPLVEVLRKAIRKQVGRNMAIQFITGHSHRRCALQLDAYASSVEAGRYLDTVGFASFPIINASSTYNQTEDFRHVMIDATKAELNDTLGEKVDLRTSKGAELSDLIVQTQHALGLDQVLGCSQHDYDLTAGIDQPFSLWALYLDEVIPSQLTEYNASGLFFQRTAAFRYHLFSGQVTVDDIIAVCPFNDTVYQVTDAILGSDVIAALADRSSLTVVGHLLPPMAMSPPHTIDPYHAYAVYVPEFDMPEIVQRLSDQTQQVYTPQALQRDGLNLTTTNMWRDFVVKQWQCGRDQQYSVRQEMALGLAWASSALLVVALIGFIMEQRCRRTRYKLVNTREVEQLRKDHDVMVDYGLTKLEA